MEEEAVHREHEMDALMQASMGDEEDHVSKPSLEPTYSSVPLFQEEDEWFQNVSHRLETLSLSSTTQHATITSLHVSFFHKKNFYHLKILLKFLEDYRGSHTEAAGRGGVC